MNSMLPLGDLAPAPAARPPAAPPPQLGAQLKGIPGRVELRPPRDPPRTAEIASAPKASLPPPHRAAFLDAPVRPAELPQCTNLVRRSEVPPLAPFPHFQFEPVAIQTDFTFSVRPLTTSTEKGGRRLERPAVNEMKKIRDEVLRDTAQFEDRMKQMKRVDLIRPVRPVTPVSEDPPTLDFSFANPRMSVHSDFVYMGNPPD
jgi:hypothetical protein